MSDLKSFATLRAQLSESAAEAAKKKLKKMRGQTVSFTHHASGEKISGTYKGLKQMGGRSYAHVETGKGAHRVPPHQIHQVQENYIEESKHNFKWFDVSKMKDQAYDHLDDTDQSMFKHAATADVGDPDGKRPDHHLGVNTKASGSRQTIALMKKYGAKEIK